MINNSQVHAFTVQVWIFTFRGGFGWQEDPKLEFNWHAFLMVVAFTILYGHGGNINYYFITYVKKKN